MCRLIMCVSPLNHHPISLASVLSNKSRFILNKIFMFYEYRSGVLCNTEIRYARRIIWIMYLCDTERDVDCDINGMEVYFVSVEHAARLNICSLSVESVSRRNLWFFSFVSWIRFI